MPIPTLEDSRTRSPDSEEPIPVTELPKGVPIPGRGRGKLVIVSDDDDHLEDFEESSA